MLSAMILQLNPLVEQTIQDIRGGVTLLPQQLSSLSLPRAIAATSVYIWWEEKLNPRLITCVKAFDLSLGIYQLDM